MKQYGISVISVPLHATLVFPKFIWTKFVYIATAILKSYVHASRLSIATTAVLINIISVEQI